MSARSRRAAVSVAVAAVATASGLLPLRGAQALAIPTPGFGTPTVSGIQFNGYEQDLRLDNRGGYIYTSAPQSLGSGTSVIWRSSDGGATFKEIPASVQPAGKPLSCAGGGDSELDVDSAGHLYFADLTLLNISTARSDDHGTSFGSHFSCTGIADVVDDRMWETSFGDPTNGGSISIADDRVAQSTPLACPNAPAASNVLVVAQSPISVAASASAGVSFGPSQVVSCDEGILGPIDSFDYGAGHGGQKVFIPHDNAALTSVSMGRCDVVAISGATPTGYANCVDTLVSSFPGSVTGANFPTATVDSSGGVTMVWEQAPGAPGAVTGDTQLRWSRSTDQGLTWSAAQTLPTPGLHQALFASVAAGDPGRIDVSFLGAPEMHTGVGGPDSTTGHYSLYLLQTLDGGATWSAPALASEHFVHYGTMYTLIGAQQGNRALGDFFQLRLGPNGEAEMSYADSNNIVGAVTPQAMFVKQNSGPSAYASVGMVTGPAPPSGGCSSDAARDATYDSAGVVGAKQPNLDVLQSCVTMPTASQYLITMQVSDLTSLGPDPAAGGTTNIWQTQWQVPSSTDANGGAIFMAYMESVAGGAPTCWVGQNATAPVGGGVGLTYPGSTQLIGAACTYTKTAPGTISITVPTSSVTEPGDIDGTLHSVTASTQIVTGNAETPPSLGGIGGQLFNLVDVAPAFDFTSAPTAGGAAETPWVPLMVAVGALGAGMALIRRRRERTHM